MNNIFCNLLFNIHLFKIQYVYFLFLIGSPSSKLIDLVIRIVNSRNFKATILHFSEIFDHVFIVGKMFLESHCSVAMPLQAVSKIHVPIYPHLISEGRRNCSAL